MRAVTTMFRLKVHLFVIFPLLCVLLLSPILCPSPLFGTFTFIMKGMRHRLQLSKSSRALNGGAYFSDVSGWKSILTSATEAYDHTESYRLLGFYLTITFCLKPTQQAVSLWNCRVCWRICLFYLYGFVTNGKYLWSPRREILQFQWQFQRETAWCAGIKTKKWLWDKNQVAYTILCGHMLL